jgi:hypothetical protein
MHVRGFTLLILRHQGLQSLGRRFGAGFEKRLIVNRASFFDPSSLSADLGPALINRQW